LFNLEQAFKTLKFHDERIAAYDSKVSEMYAELVKTRDQSDDQPLLPPSLPVTNKTAKEQKNAAGKATLQKYMKFDLTVIPGVDYDTAVTVISELGNQFDRFPDEHHFASYLGLAPSLGKSAGKNVRQRRRCKNTSRAGRALRMAASSLWRSKTALGAYFQSVARRSDKKTAIRATARRIAHMIYRGVRYGKEFIDIGAEAYEARLRVKSLKTINKMIKTYNVSLSEIEMTLAKPPHPMRV
jgi:hypothetical protein